VWSYKARTGEESSTLTILRVESLPKVGVILHVRIDGIKLKNCSGGHSPTTIQHAPFSREAIDRSVLKLVSQGNVIPDYEAGYLNWREHCGGIYTIPVAEMVSVDEKTLNGGMTCSD
jgi:hypothetical protein